MISSCTSCIYISQLEIDQGPGRFQPPCMTAMKLAENAVVGSERRTAYGSSDHPMKLRPVFGVHETYIHQET